MTEVISVDKFDSLCRLCATYDMINMDIYGDKGRQRNLPEKISTCLPFQISEDDCLPKFLCYKCIFHLETFYEFRKDCIKAISLLEDFLRQSGKQINSCTRTELPSLKIETCNLVANENFVDWSSNQGKENTAEYHNAEPLNPSDFLEACLDDSPSPNDLTDVEAKTTNNVNDIKSNPGEKSSQIFKCKSCSRAFASHASLVLHSKFHVESKKQSDTVREMFPCYTCDKVFGSRHHLAQHSRVHMSETQRQQKIYRCELCKTKTFSNAKHLWNHVSSVHRGHPLLTCQICHRMFSSICNLHDHIKIKHKSSSIHHPVRAIHKQTSFKQEIKVESPMAIEESEGDDDGNKNDDKKNDENCSSRRKMLKPRKIERESDDNKTEESNNQVIDLDQEAIIKQEQDSSHHDLEVVDDMMECDVEFAAESLVESETVFCCEICIREFSDRGSLWLHMLYTHREEASKACGLCLKIFTDNDALIQHVETCNPRGAERRRYSCTVCARQHDSRKKLVAHARIHRLIDEQGNAVDPESVVVLNSNSLANPAAGYNHSVIDEGAAFQCTVCYKPFETEIRMIKHKASAHREKPAGNAYYFACDICGLASLNRTDKWRHISTEHAGEPSLTCPQPQCNKIFASEQIKKEHCDSHHDIQGVYPSTCEVCGKLWNTRVEYWKHMMGVHPDCLPLVCGVCLKVYCNLSDLVHHVRETHYPLTGGEHCCDICGRPYSKVSKMSRHRKIHSTVPIPEDVRIIIENPVSQNNEGLHFMEITGPPYACEQCPSGENVYSCSTLEELGAHRREVHNSVPCDLCTKFYASTSQLWKHVSRAHKNHPDVTCSICKRTSANRVILSAHMSKHRSQQLTRENSEEPDPPDLDDTEHTCIKCNKVFRKGSLMRKHFKHCKGPRAAPAVASLPPPVNGISTCAKCGKQFMSQNTLYKHMKSVHVIYTCELCPESKHDSKTLLYQHVLELHRDHPSLKCDISGCDKILRTNSDMLRHRRTHNQVLTVYICKFCAELLPSKMKMRKHLKISHSSESKYLCFICMQAAPSYQDLENHVAEFHSALVKRPNTCKFCGRTCSSKSKLIDHIKNHSSAFHPCRMCLKIFDSPETLKVHVENHPTGAEPVLEDAEVDEDDDEIEEVELDEGSIMDIIGAKGTRSIESLQSVDDSIDSPGVKTVDTSTTDESKRKQDSELDGSNHKKMKLDFSCIVCDETFETRSSLLAHQEEEHDDLTCKKCGTVSGSSEDHEIHSKKCEEEEGREASQLLENLMTQDSIGSPSSPEDFENTNGELLTERLSRHKNPRKVYVDDIAPSACQICGKVWPAKKHLWQHLIRFHKNEAASTCGVCLACFPDYKSLSAHILSKHPNNYDGEGTNLTCRVCGKYHNARAKLNSHVSIHVGQEERALASSHLCLICNRAFPLFNKLSEHFFNIHKNEAEELKKLKVKKVTAQPGRRRSKKNNAKLPFYQCDICSLVFATEIGLTNHKWTHKNSDSFKCGQCGEVFTLLNDLKAHRTSKHPGSEFICAECKLAFPTYSALSVHNKECITKQQKTLEQEILEVSDEDEEEKTTKEDDKSESSSSSDSDSSDSSEESSDSEDSEETGDEKNNTQSNENNTEQYTKCNLSESSTSEDEENRETQPNTVPVTDVEIVEIDANTSNSNVD